MITILTATFVSKSVVASVYDIQIALAGVPMLEPGLPDDALCPVDSLRAKSVMTKQVKVRARSRKSHLKRSTPFPPTHLPRYVLFPPPPPSHQVIGERVPHQTITELLRSCPHHGFPIVDGPYFAGLISRAKLEEALAASHVSALRRRWFKTEGTTATKDERACNGGCGAPAGAEKAPSRLATPSGREMRSMICEGTDSAMSSVEPSPTRNGGGAAGNNGMEAAQDAGASFDPPAAEPLVDLRPLCDRTPYTVNEMLPLRRVLRLFKAMGLRHLVVVDSRSRVVGIITRRNLVEAEHGRKFAPECIELEGAPRAPPAAHVPRTLPQCLPQRLRTSRARRHVGGDAAAHGGRGPPRGPLGFAQQPRLGGRLLHGHFAGIREARPLVQRRQPLAVPSRTRGQRACATCADTIKHQGNGEVTCVGGIVIAIGGGMVGVEC